MKRPIELPLIHVRDLVFYPGMRKTLIIGRDFTIRAITHAKKKTKGRLIVATQKSVENLKPFAKGDNYSTGTVCQVVQSILLTDGTMKVLLEALDPIRLQHSEEREGVRFAVGEIMARGKPASGRIEREAKEAFLETIVRWNPRITFQEVSRFDDLRNEKRFDRFLKIALEIASHPVFAGSFKHGKKKSAKDVRVIHELISSRQKILEQADRKKQFQMLSVLLTEESRLRAGQAAV